MKARTLLFMCALLFAPNPSTNVHAQSTGSISGRVTDSQGSALPATVTAAGISISASASTQADRNGHYQMLNLVPGTYFMRFASPGFKTGEEESVVVSSDQETQIDKVLSLSSGGGLAGLLTDPNGAVVPGATITLRNLATSMSVSAITNGDGRYSFQNLDVGNYSVSIESTGFKKLEVESVTVMVGQTNEQNFTLAAGDIGRTITISTVEGSGIRYRPRIASPAKPGPTGFLELESGYDANFRAKDVRTVQTVPFAVRFVVHPRILLTFAGDLLRFETGTTGTSRTGFGDVRLGLQTLLNDESARHPAVAIGYQVKLPSADEARRLGSGRVDHKLLLALSKRFGRTSVDFNAAALVVGRTNQPGWIVGGQTALALTHPITTKLDLINEISWQSKNDVQPKGVFTLGAIAYKINPSKVSGRLSLVLDGGVRIGLNPNAPRVGVFGGLTVGIANVFK